VAVRRRLLNVFTVLSVLLCVAVGVLWVRSHHAIDFAQAVTGERTIIAATQLDFAPTPGRLVIEYTDAAEDRTGVTFGTAWIKDIPNVCIATAGRVYKSDLPCGFAYRRSYVGATLFQPGVTSHTLVVPLWFLFVLTLAPPACRLPARGLRPRSRSGECASCGYDLRATPQRCPECGRMAAAGAAAGRPVAAPFAAGGAFPAGVLPGRRANRP
jgi:hypothetical protein